MRDVSRPRPRVKRSTVVFNGKLAFSAPIVAAGNAAVGAWARMLAYCVWCGDTDPTRLDMRIVRVIAGPAIMRRLEQAGLLRRDGGAATLLTFQVEDAPAFKFEFRSSGSWPTSAYDAVFARDGGACRYCRSTERLQIDHVKPRVRGGGHGIGNLVAACRKCNLRKGGRTPEQAGMTILPIPADDLDAFGPSPLDDDPPLATAAPRSQDR